jgi:uncharacterized protein YehS (DUF1456 family)
LTHNEIFARISSILDFDDSTLSGIFGFSEIAVTPGEIRDWLRPADDPEFKEMDDDQMTAFLDGLIVKNRGKREGPRHEPDTLLNNNSIFRKLRIALELNDADVVELMDLAGFPIRKQELSALFRKSDHKNFRPCLDPMLRNFLNGLGLRFPPKASPAGG